MKNTILSILLAAVQLPLAVYAQNELTLDNEVTITDDLEVQNVFKMRDLEDQGISPNSGKFTWVKGLPRLLPLDPNDTDVSPRDVVNPQVIYLSLGDVIYIGSLEVKLTSSYNHSPNFGSTGRRFGFGRSQGNPVSSMSLETTSHTGNITNTVVIGDPEIGPSNDLRIPIYYIGSLGNFLTVELEGLAFAMDPNMQPQLTDWQALPAGTVIEPMKRNLPGTIVANSFELPDGRTFNSTDPIADLAVDGKFKLSDPERSASAVFTWVRQAPELIPLDPNNPGGVPAINVVNPQVMYVELGNINYSGVLEISATGGFDQSLVAGLLRKRYAMAASTGGPTRLTGVEVVDVLGPLRDVVSLGNPEIGPDGGLRVPVYYIGDNGNFITIQVKGFTDGISGNQDFALTDWEALPAGTQIAKLDRDLEGKLNVDALGISGEITFADGSTLNSANSIGGGSGSSLGSPDGAFQDVLTVDNNSSVNVNALQAVFSLDSAVAMQLLNDTQMILTESVLLESSNQASIDMLDDVALLSASSVAGDAGDVLITAGNSDIGDLDPNTDFDGGDIVLTPGTGTGADGQVKIEGDALVTGSLKLAGSQGDIPSGSF